LRNISDADHFVGGARDQVMLFTAPPPSPSSLPAHVQQLDAALRGILTPHLPADVSALAFGQPLARQAILNLYPPGAGITPHIDLPGRYADGIVGVSLAGGCVMTLQRGEARHDIYLPPRSVYVFSGEVRWDWSHGIAYRTYDVVQDGGAETTLPRDLRVSVTLRWMQEGAGLLS
jgi:alkylated DNA repair dioxygenase AlkB